MNKYMQYIPYPSAKKSEKGNKKTRENTKCNTNDVSRAKNKKKGDSHQQISLLFTLKTNYT